VALLHRVALLHVSMVRWYLQGLIVKPSFEEQLAADPEQKAFLENQVRLTTVSAPRPDSLPRPVLAVLQAAGLR
jgi:hypothetical protein